MGAYNELKLIVMENSCVVFLSIGHVLLMLILVAAPELFVSRVWT